VTAIQHDPGLASLDDFTRDETVARLVNRYQGNVLFCDHPDCDLYVAHPIGDDTLERRPDGELLCAKHR